MPDRLLPQRWSEPISALTDQDGRGAARQEQESVLKVLLDFLALVRRNYRVVVLTALAAVAVLLVQLRYDHPLYRATAVVRFEDKGRALSGGLASAGAQQLGGPATDPILTQIQVLQSRAVARAVVEREGLRIQGPEAVPLDGWLADVAITDAEYQGELNLAFTSRSYQVSRGTTTVSVPYGQPAQLGPVTFTVLRAPLTEHVTVNVMPLERAVDGLLTHLRGRGREHTDVIDISYDDADPQRARRVANSTAQTFQLMSAQTAKQESLRRRQFIQEQLKKSETLLAEAQRAHSNFRIQQQVYSSQEKFRNQQADLTGIEVRRRELQSDRETYQRLLTSLRDPRPSGGSGERLGALVSSPGIASNVVVAQLYQQLTRLQTTRDSLVTGAWSASKDNPDVKRLDVLIASAEANIAAAVRGQVTGIDERIAALDELKRRSAVQMAVLPTTEAAEAGLLGNVETFRRESDKLREELQKAQIEEAAEGGQIDVVDLATLPLRPIGTGRVPRLLFTLLIGVALGAVFSYVLENYTHVLRRREEVERVAMAPTFAVIPPLDGTQDKPNRLLAWMHPNGRSNGVVETIHHRKELVTVVDMRSHAAESFRTLRTNLLFSSAVRDMRQVIVTSAGPSEGKSTTAANLAVAFAQQGQRVLIVDADLRRPRIHQVFGRTQIPGLTNVLMGSMSFAALTHETDIPGLSVLTAGPTPPNPAELLGGVRMQELMASLAQNYDMVIVDTPPVLIASDAAILSRFSGGTLVVVRAGRTQAAALRDAVEQLGNVGTRVIGTVLNDPDGEVAKFTSYYGYYYNDYYNAPVEA